jgi:hypothetical protein
VAAAPTTTKFDVSDYLEIQRLMFSFNVRFDEGDADGFAALFTEDGFLDAGSGPCPTDEERRAKVIGSRSRPPHRHFTTNVIIDPDPSDPNRARSYAHFIYMEVVDGTTETRSIGTYNDELVKQDGRWLFQRRKATSDKLGG